MALPSPSPSPSPLGSSSSDIKRKRVNRLAKLAHLELEAHREQRHMNQSNGSHADFDVNTTDPGEVIHPRLSIHSATASLEPKGMKSKSRNGNSEFTSCFLLRIKSSEKKVDKIHIGRNDVSVGHVETETSPKLCGDNSPVSKATKVSRGSRGGKTMPCHRKNGMFNSREKNQKDPSKGKARNSQSQCHGCGTCRNSGWVPAVDGSDLHRTMHKIPDSFLNEDKHHENRSTAALSRERDGSDARSAVKIPSPTGRAWMQDDVSRPTCLPSFKREQNPSRTIIKYRNSRPWPVPDNPPDDVASPYQCPICTEDFDSTDSSFDPCPCGFRLCLFCYHKIASDDGRCPGCRKTYKQNIPLDPQI